MNKIINGDAVEDDANKWKHEERSGEKNPLGVVPIVEYFRSYDRMECGSDKFPKWII